jgi:hypothetical protein
VQQPHQGAFSTHTQPANTCSGLSRLLLLLLLLQTRLLLPPLLPAQVEVLLAHCHIQQCLQAERPSRRLLLLLLLLSHLPNDAADCNRSREPATSTTQHQGQQERLCQHT